MDEGVKGYRIDYIPEKGKSRRIVLPVSSDGRYYFDNIEDKELSEKFYFEYKDDAWHAFCIPPLHFFRENGMWEQKIRIDGTKLIRVDSKSGLFLLYIDVITEKSGIYDRYQIIGSNEITIGRADDNDIVYENPYASRYHAKILIQNNSLFIEDCGSTNGILINGLKEKSSKVFLGDSIYILGLNLIIGVGFIAINQNSNFRINERKIRKISIALSSNAEQKISANDTEKLFNRLPRRISAFTPNDIKLEAPPPPINGNQIPMFLRMGSSMVMGGSAALAGNYMMLLTSFLFPFMTQKYGDKEKKEYEQKRIEKYGEYLVKKTNEIEAEKSYEERTLTSNYPKLSDVLLYPLSGSKMWERRIDNDDFMSLRVGHGRLEMFGKIESPTQRFDVDTDALQDSMEELANRKVFLENVPINIDFAKYSVVSISGNEKSKKELTKRIIANSTILHSYDELKTIFLIDENELENEFEFIKWLPHSWNDQKDFRFIATSESDAYKIGEYLKNEISLEGKSVDSLKQALKTRPFFLVFALNKKIYDGVEFLKDVVRSDRITGLTLVTAFEDLPKECDVLIDVSGNNSVNSITYLKEISREKQEFSFDEYEEFVFSESIRRMSNTYLKNSSQEYSLPKTLSFLEMFGVGKIEHLNIANRWSNNNPVKSLQAPIGIAVDGSLFYLDLHQKNQGPHGLVAGTTGSGKSEFLITYILSMAINYHPDEVAFVLIDYKGGGLASAFVNEKKGIRLPHLVGTITNLDGSSIQRSLISINSEIKRRQKVFEQVKQETQEGTMDIYLYQKLYRNKVVSVPMPHLFIISDEFAELKAQQPEFMDELISAARIGRSLGVHLILATQKPSGVVNDQIRSNTKFRVCLKVQDKEDSMDMLKRPEAAELKDAGRFYLQVGYNEFFALGQSGWAGADYVPQDEVIRNKDESIQVIDSLAQTYCEIKPNVKKADAEGTQLVSIVKAISKLADELNIEKRMLWKPALQSVIDLEENFASEDDDTSIKCKLGLVDDPEEQRQFELEYDFLQKSHLLISGEAASGKTSIVQSILYSLSKNYSPAQVNFYILDFSSRMLPMYKSLPHCGAVLLEDDIDSVSELFKLLTGIIQERKKLFNELNVDSFISAREIKPMPLIVFVIDNFAGLTSNKIGETLAFELPKLLSESQNYGVRFVITCAHASDVSIRIRQEMGERISFHAKDKYEFSDLLGCKVEYVPPEMPGRGLCKYEDRPLEFQAYLLKSSLERKKRTDAIKKDIELLAKHYSDSKKAPGLRTFSDKIQYEVFCNMFDEKRIPLGFSLQTKKPIAIPLKQLSKLLIYQGNANGNEVIIRNLLEACKRESMELWFVKKKDKSITETEFSIDATVFESTNDGATEIWQKLFPIMNERSEIRKTYLTEKGIAFSDESKVLAADYMIQNTKPIMLFFEDFEELKAELNFTNILVFTKLLNSLAGLNVYAIGMFYPSDNKTVQSGMFSESFMNENIILFGGKYNKQSLLDEQTLGNNSNETLPYNVSIMWYKAAIYPLLMPCGDISNSDIDTDYRNIFEV